MNDLAEKVDTAIGLLERAGVVFEPGLSDAEIRDTERRFGFRFPPDLAAFLQVALPVELGANPVNPPFPDWRSGAPDDLAFRTGWPFEGMAFDVEHTVFWPTAWGPRPERLEDALAVARRHYDAAPRLIPIYTHRYIADDPLEAGNPILSVHQMDIIYYGQDLWDYFEQEFEKRDEDWCSGQRYAGWTPEQYHAAHKRIRFWSDFVG